jgi:hypothetical protein
VRGTKDREEETVKIYKIEVTGTVIVAANGDLEAKRVFESVKQDSLEDAKISSVTHITDVDQLPGEWDGDCLPYVAAYSEYEDMTIREILNGDKPKE